MRRFLERLRHWRRGRAARGVRYSRPLRFSVRCRLSWHDWVYSETGYSRRCERCHVIEAGCLLVP